LAKYAERFNNDRPDIQIQRVCNPSAIIAEKLLAEKYHPQGDAIWGWRRLPVTGPHDRLRNRPVRSLDPGSGGLVGTEMGCKIAELCNLAAHFRSRRLASPAGTPHSRHQRSGVIGGSSDDARCTPSAHVWHRPDAEKATNGLSMRWVEGTMTQHENFARLVSASAERVRYKAGDVILKEGDYGDRMFILTAGRAQITIRNQLLETVEEGDVFGEMALVDAGPRGASVVAETDCEAAPVDARRFEFMVVRRRFSRSS
jgi:CRP/FNR family transcriptional regulator, cyclic AMP receptor protein